MISSSQNRRFEQCARSPSGSCEAEIAWKASGRSRARRCNGSEQQGADCTGRGIVHAAHPWWERHTSQTGIIVPGVHRRIHMHTGASMRRTASAESSPSVSSVQYRLQPISDDPDGARTAPT
ncbi:hypothetical protein KM043_014729 [Ampulex compressa]|nr:hypothetical protein KM043_014729 [Ampulex compressa]